jgi:uncharacterized protein involved in type VI secretion and phage assembly
VLKFSGRTDFLEQYSVSGLSVEQELGATGTLVVDLRTREPSVLSVFDEHTKLQELLGSELACEWDGWLFFGWVENIEYSAITGNFSLLVRDSLSKLEDQFSSQVFSETTVEDIVNSIMASVDLTKFRFVGEVGSSRVVLSIQYQESLFEYLKRLLSSCGAQIWCVGEEILVGDIPEENTGEYQLERDILTFTLSTGAGKESLTMKSIAYSEKNRISSEKIELKNAEFGSLQDSVVDLRVQSERSSSFHVVQEDDAFGQSKLRGIGILKSGTRNRFVLRGTTKFPAIIGSTIDIKSFDKNYEANENLETVLVSAITGYSPTGLAQTTWQFEGVNPEFLLGNCQTPQNVALKSTAIVTETSDSFNRVKVTFPWDPRNAVTPWLRVASASWGEGHFQYLPPKIGDTVLVTWGQWDMDAIVLASLAAGEEVETPDDVFRMQTVEGHKISIDGENIKILNEASGGGSQVVLSPDKLVVTTSDGHTVEIGSDTIVLSHAGGSQVVLDNSGIRLEAQGDLIISATGKVEISNSAASVNLAGPTVSINNGALEVT